MADNSPTLTPVEGLVERVAKAIILARFGPDARKEGEPLFANELAEAKIILAAFKPTGERGELVERLMRVADSVNGGGDSPLRIMIREAAARITADAALIEAKDAEIAAVVRRAEAAEQDMEAAEAKLAEARAALERGTRAGMTVAERAEWMIETRELLATLANITTTTATPPAAEDEPEPHSPEAWRPR